ncbi:hypothetical protein GCM10027194_18940 [Thalassiella azotivora]
MLTAALTGVVGLLLGAALGVAGTLALTGRDAGAWELAGPAEERLPERLPELVTYVEERTGRSFTSEPVVEVLGDAAFERALAEPSPVAEDLAAGTDQPAGDFAATAEALGLTEDADRLTADAEGSWSGGVAGFYDPATDRLVVRGTQWTPTVEATVVHELVHALQDQHVDLDAATAATRDDDDTYLALSAVSEGQASVVETDWVDQQDARYQDLYWDEDVPGGSLPQEPLTEALWYLPYDLGWTAVTDLESAGGTEAVWRALADPPVTLEQVRDAAAWQAGGAHLADPVPVVAPAAPQGAEVLDTGSLGTYLLTLLTVEDPQEWFWLEESVAGWAGDRYVTWVQGGGACTAADVVLDDGRALEDLTAGLEPWVAAGGAVTVTGAPGPDGAAPGAVLRLQRCSG